MGHKVHPTIHRLNVIYPWNSRWCSKDNYAAQAEQDVRIRVFLKKKFKTALIDDIAIERGQNNLTVTILAAKTGLIIGRGGKGLEDLQKELERKFLKMSTKVRLQIKEIANPALSAAVVAENISHDLERRVRFRRVMKQSIERVMKAGGQGVKVALSGRLNGVEIARTEKLFAGKVPLITLRSDVDYAFTEAHTTYGKIGVKVWIYKGEVFGIKDKFSGVNVKSDDAGSKKNKEVNKPSKEKK